MKKVTKHMLYCIYGLASEWFDTCARVCHIASLTCVGLTQVECMLAVGGKSLLLYLFEDSIPIAGVMEVWLGGEPIFDN